jgi:hypothetical protein
VASSLVVFLDQGAPQRGQQQYSPQHGNLNYRAATSQTSFKCGRPATWRQQRATSYQGSSTRISQVQSAAARRCYSSSLILSVCPSVQTHSSTLLHIFLYSIHTFCFVCFCQSTVSYNLITKSFNRKI